METEEPNGILDLNPAPPQPVGIYGWRKRCLYAFVLILMVVVILNLALTIWILRVLHFSLDGMGRLKVVQKGFELEGEAEFLKPVYVNKLTSNKKQPLYIQSAKAVELVTTDKKNKVRSKLVVDDKAIDVKCDTFRVEDSKGNVNLLVAENTAMLGTKDASFEGNIQFKGSVATPNIRGPVDETLRIQSESSAVKVSGATGVSLTSHLGNITLTAPDTIKIHASSGPIVFKSTDMYITDLLQPRSRSTVFQLCLCRNGRAFLSPANRDCRDTLSFC